MPDNEPNPNQPTEQQSKEVAELVGKISGFLAGLLSAEGSRYLLNKFFEDRKSERDAELESIAMENRFNFWTRFWDMVLVLLLLAGVGTVGWFLHISGEITAALLGAIIGNTLPRFHPYYHKSEES